MKQYMEQLRNINAIITSWLFLFILPSDHITLLPSFHLILLPSYHLTIWSSHHIQGEGKTRYQFNTQIQMLNLEPRIQNFFVPTSTSRLGRSISPLSAPPHQSLWQGDRMNLGIFSPGVELSGADRGRIQIQSFESNRRRKKDGWNRDGICSALAFDSVPVLCPWFIRPLLAW